MLSSPAAGVVLAERAWEQAWRSSLRMAFESIAHDERQALLRRGIPQRLYVDNGANYRSQQLALVCAKLGVALIHARPHQPQGKGKQERWFRTVRAQLLATLSEADTASLEALNRRLWAGWRPSITTARTAVWTA